MTVAIILLILAVVLVGWRTTRNVYRVIAEHKQRAEAFYNRVADAERAILISTRASDTARERNYEVSREQTLLRLKVTALAEAAGYEYNEGFHMPPFYSKKGKK